MVKTTAIRKAHRVFRLLDCFGGKLIVRGLDGQCTSETYRGFLALALTHAGDHLTLIQDNVSYHPSGPLQPFHAQLTDRLTVYHLPPRLPGPNPIEVLRKKSEERCHPSSLLSPICRLWRQSHRSAHGTGWDARQTHCPRRRLPGDHARCRLTPRLFI